jgi:hypothetical protein
VSKFSSFWRPENAIPAVSWNHPIHGLLAKFQALFTILATWKCDSSRSWEPRITVSDFRCVTVRHFPQDPWDPRLKFTLLLVGHYPAFWWPENAIPGGSRDYQLKYTWFLVKAFLAFRRPINAIPHWSWDLRNRIFIPQKRKEYALTRSHDTWAVGLKNIIFRPTKCRICDHR